MLGKWTNKSTWMLLFVLMAMMLSGGMAQAGTYNATGRWAVNYTLTALTQGCVSPYPKEWVLTVAQSNDTFTLSESSLVADSGKVTDDAYALNVKTPFMTREVAFKLTSENLGTGTITTTWPALTSGFCTEQGDIKVSRTMEPVFNLTGSWTLQVGADVLDPKMPNASSCESAPARTLSVNIIQSGTTINMEIGGSTLVTGEVDGGVYTLKHIDSAVKTDWTSYRFLMTNKDAGNGTIQWVRKGATCSGSNTITMTRSDQEPVDPNATLGMAPLNLTVGSTRMLALQHVTGTPTFTASPETGVITLTSTSGITNVTCDAPGQAVVTVTDANGAATANIVCVAPPVKMDSIAIADWMLPSGVTLVTRNLKKNNHEGSVPVQSFHWSRAGKTANFLERGSVSLVEGDDGRYYSFNDTGLIIHGEKHWDVAKEKLIHKAQYGFVRAPVLTADNMSISQEDVAIANTTVPGPILPATISDGYADTVTRIAFNLDANSKPIPDQWNVSKQDIVAHVNLNLLDSVLPENLQDDDYFKEWRDAITDTGLLSKLTSVVHIHRSVTHWEAGNPTPWVEHADFYLVKGLGVVYEKRHELDGVAKKVLVAQKSDTALVSLTNHTITDRKFTIDAPVGVTLENPFVLLRVDHTSNLPASDRHIHQVAGSYNEATGSGSPLLTVYARSNVPVLDSTDVVTLTYGATGFESQKMADVDMAAMTSPMVLTLRPEHQGRAVTFTAKDSSGVQIKSGGLLIYPYKNGTCVQNLVASHDLAESGKVSFILADGQHCAALMPAKIGDFIGGYYDPSVAFGQINIVATVDQGAGIPFKVSSSSADFHLVAGRDDGPDHSLVSGRLTDGTNGLSNADILAYPKQGGAPLLFQTDKDGNFSFDLPAGQYVFGFRHVGNGFISQGFLTGQGETNTLSANREQGVAQTIFANTLMGSVSLTAAFKTSTVTLSGVITDKTDSKISGSARVKVASIIPGGFFTQTTTDATGGYSVQVLPNADYFIQVEANGTGTFYRGYVDAGKKLTATQSAQAAISVFDSMTLNLELTKDLGVATQTISGKVNDNATPPAGIAQVTVRAVDQTNNSNIFTTQTDAQGQFTLPVVAGSYQIEVFAHGYIGGLVQGTLDTVKLGGNADAQNYVMGGEKGLPSLTLNPVLAKVEKTALPNSGAARITVNGTVSGSLGALQNILVEFMPDPDKNTGFVERTAVKTDSAGHYTASIYPGFYRVMFRAQYKDPTTGTLVLVLGVIGDGGFADGSGQVVKLLEKAKMFEFAADSTLDAALSNGVPVSGLVTDAKGVAIKGVQVEFQPDFTTDAGPWVQTTTDDKGKYVAYVQPGTVYRVMFNTHYMNVSTKTQVQLDALGGYSEGASDLGVNGDFMAAKQYTFTAPSEVNVVLQTGLNIHGVVTSDGTSGIAGVRVVLQPEMDVTTGSFGVSAETITDANGAYSFNARPGQYRVEFVTTYWDNTNKQTVILPGNPIGGYADGKGGVIHDRMAAHLYRFTDTVEIKAILKAGVPLSGTVTLTDGTQVKGAQVSIHSQDWETSFWAKTDAQGTFSVLVNPGVDYLVEVWPAFCDVNNTDENAGCGVGHMAFQGGHWITPPDANWVSGWNPGDLTTRPLVVSSALKGDMVIPGGVMPNADVHMLTNIRVDRPLALNIQVDNGKPVQVRIVDGDGRGVPFAWVDSDFGSGPTNQEGVFTLNLPSSSTVSGANSDFVVNISPGGYEDPVSHAWVEGSKFLGGVVTGSVASGFTLMDDAQQATRFAIDASAWPAMELPNNQTGLLVKVRQGIAITGQVLGTANQGLANQWVNAWSYDTGTGGGATTAHGGDFSIQVPTPANGVTVWYEVTTWSDQHLTPDPVLVKVQSLGVVGVYAIKKDGFVEANGIFKPVAAEALLEDSRGNVPVKLVMGTGITIQGRVMDAANNGLPWVWVDMHTKDGSKAYGANTDENGYYSMVVAQAKNYIGVVWGVGGQYRTTFYKNAGKEVDAQLIDASGNTNLSGIDFMMSSGGKISGTLVGLSKGTKVWVNVWSEGEHAWGGTEVTGAGTGEDAFSITGLPQAKDYRLDWRFNNDELPGGYYGGVIGGQAIGPKSWELATLLNTMNGNVTGVKIDLAATGGKILKVKIEGLTAGAKVDVDVRSEKLNFSRWKQTKADAKGQAILELKGLDPTGDDYRLFVSGPDATFKVGHFMGVLGANDYPATPGALVGLDRATRIGMAGDQYVYVKLGSGRKLTVSVKGLKSGQRAWVDAFSEKTGAWGGAGVVFGNGTTDKVDIKGLESSDDYRISIWGEKIQGGSYAGEGLAPGVWEKAELVDLTTSDKTINLSVSAGRTISGKVTGMKSNQWGWVEAWSNATFSWGGNSMQAAGGGTDTYTIAGLGQAADFRVLFDADGYVSQKYAQDVSTMNEDATEVNFTATTGGSITGSLTGLNPYERVRVDAWSPATDHFIVSSATANASGSATYTLDGVPEGNDYVVAVWRGNKGLYYAQSSVTPVWDNHSKVTVTGSNATKSIDFNLTTAGNLFNTLSGTVSGLGADQVVEVTAWSATGGATTQLTGNGTYTLEGLPAGNYTVEVVSSGYVTQRTSTVTVSSNKVTNASAAWTSGLNNQGTVALTGNTTGLDVTLSTGYAIKGSVISGSVALPGVWVNAWSAGTSMGGGGMTNAKGEFIINGLVSGTYSVEVWTPEGTASKNVTVSNANVTGETLSLTKPTGTIKGKVTDASGTVAGNALVIVYDDKGVEKDRALVNTTTGSYTLDGLTLDLDYTVKVFSSSKVKAGTWSTTTSGYANGTVKAVATGGTLNLTLN